MPKYDYIYYSALAHDFNYALYPIAIVRDIYEILRARAAQEDCLPVSGLRHKQGITDPEVINFYILVRPLGTRSTGSE